MTTSQHDISTPENPARRDKGLEVLSRIDGSTGAKLGPADFRVSDMGGTGDASHAALRPAVAARGSRGDVLVVWDGTGAGACLTPGEWEVFGERLRLFGDAPTGEAPPLLQDAFESGGTHAWSCSVSPAQAGS